MTSENIIRLGAVGVSFVIHILAIYMIPGEIRQLFIDMLRETLQTTTENVTKTVAVLIGLAGVVFLTLSTTFLSTVSFLTAIILNESVQNMPLKGTIVFLLVFCVIFVVGLISYHVENSYSDLDELEQNIVQSTE